MKNKEDFYKLIESYFFKSILPNGLLNSHRNFINYVMLGMEEKFYYTRNGKQTEYNSGGLRKLLYKYVMERKETKSKISKEINILPNNIGFEFEEGDNEFIVPYKIWEGDLKVLVLSDIHLPYHDLDALKTAINYGKKEIVNCIILNGDILDIYQLSRFDKNPSKKVLKEELELCRIFLKQLRTLFPSEKIIYKCGNHDLRLETYLLRKAPELFGIDAITLRDLLKLKDLNIDWVESSRTIMAGKLMIAHGHEFGGGGGINAARSIFLKATHNLLVGHFHRSQEFIQRNASDESIGVYVTGCLCFLKPEYLPHNNWNHGFAIVHTYTDGSFTVENKRIIKGKVV